MKKLERNLFDNLRAGSDIYFWKATKDKISSDLLINGLFPIWLQHNTILGTFYAELKFAIAQEQILLQA